MQSVLQFTAQQFGRAIVMPNLFDPITSTSKAEVYRREIIEALGNLKIKSNFDVNLRETVEWYKFCLLYTSDAADE